MPNSRRWRRGSRAALGLALMLALGFAADALVLATTRARADGTLTAGELVKSQRRAFDRPSDPEDKTRSSRATLIRHLENGASPARSESWSLGMIGITLALAVCGGIVAVGRRFAPHGAATGMRVVGRVGLSPRHTVYLLRVGQRVLLVGTGPQGSPTLISELDDDIAGIQTELPVGEHP